MRFSQICTVRHRLFQVRAGMLAGWLPNPDMVMYLYPHLADGNTPVPGYSTVFPFYSQTQYAMPGERTEAL